ncbi:MAG: hypothetical protein K2L02_02565 [Clostridia bacterium]|nr:hypothetical protein [Clostridia bacterium]
MKINRKKAAAVAVAAIMTCGMFAGCDLVIQNENENMKQTVAEVNIKDSANFQKEFTGVNDELLTKVIGTASVSKRDMIATFVGSGYSAMSSYGWSYKDTFDAIIDSLVQRQVYIQYAKAYFLKNGWTDKDDNNKEYTYNELEKFNAAVKDKEGVDYDIAATAYFLTKKEIDKATYTTRVMFNNSIDSLEDRFIKKDDDDTDYETDVRTTPTGLNTSNSDYCPAGYQVYTGTGKQSGVHVYEPKDGSTTTTRLRAYNELLASLKSNGLVENGEDTSNIESLQYYKLEQKGDLEDALIQKMTDTFTKQAEEKLTEDYLKGKFETTLENQSDIYAKSSSSLESDMDSVSDSKFVLTAVPDQPQFGFVINILLPFSAAQSDELSSVTQDFGDTKGNKFMARAKLLSKIKATDQRGSWFTGETDYSFKVTGEDAADKAKKAYGYQEGEREWLFFEDNLNDSKSDSKYDRLKNYYGKYTYNGKVSYNEETKKYALQPKKITIDDFIDEMEGYLNYAFDGTVASGAKKNDYSTDYYNEDGSVNYGQFVYYEGSVDFGSDGFNANQIFKAGTPENKAMSVINELSFAYNTDTGGLNSYLGYAVTANKTNFVSEFEFAAQKVVSEGAGHYIVVPSDYGWHIIYCTFSFVGGKDYEGINTPFAYDHESREQEGTFSYLFYESYKADTASKESTNRRSQIISSYKDSYTIYEDRFEDLSNLDNRN